jgi:hypothetical protein
VVERRGGKMRVESEKKRVKEREGEVRKNTFHCDFF